MGEKSPFYVNGRPVWDLFGLVKEFTRVPWDDDPEHSRTRLIGHGCRNHVEKARIEPSEAVQSLHMDSSLFPNCDRGFRLVKRWRTPLSSSPQPQLRAGH